MQAPSAHKVSVEVEGWLEVVPAITVDRVGVFMHDMHPPIGSARSVARLVTEVSMRDGQKLIELRSAILVRNETGVPLEFRLEPAVDVPAVILPPLLPSASVSIPTHLTNAIVRLRRYLVGELWSTTGIAWSSFPDMKRPGERRGLCLSCRRIGPSTDSTLGHSIEPTFYCCASVALDPVPVALEPGGPSYTLTLYPPILLQNLLPYEFQYFIMDTDLSGDLRPGASVALYDLDPRQFVRLRIKIAGFALSSGALICADSPAMTVDRTVHLTDSRNRSLIIDMENVRIRGSGGARKVSLIVPYWLLNYTTLPLYYKQHARSHLAAGQPSDKGEASRPRITMFACDGEAMGHGNKCNVSINEVN